jgi:catechol 2,3-dioxygenase-like lactoylglutathione lyase family enzyme
MLANTDARATLAVRDIKAAVRFYEGILGLKQQDSGEASVLIYEAGGSKIFVYESQYAGTNQATAVTWLVDDVDAEVMILKARGLSFEHYAMPDTKLEGDVYVSARLKNAWFKDPDGNIHAIVGPVAPGIG